MRSLIRKLQKWYIKHQRLYDEDIYLTKWQRDIIYDFIINFIKGVKKENG